MVLYYEDDGGFLGGGGGSSVSPEQIQSRESAADHKKRLREIARKKAEKIGYAYVQAPSKPRKITQAEADYVRSQMRAGAQLAIRAMKNVDEEREKANAAFEQIRPKGFVDAVRRGLTSPVSVFDPPYLDPDTLTGAGALRADLDRIRSNNPQQRSRNRFKIKS